MHNVNDNMNKEEILVLYIILVPDSSKDTYIINLFSICEFIAQSKALRTSKNIHDPRAYILLILCSLSHHHQQQDKKNVTV